MNAPREQFLLEEAPATRELIRSSIAEARSLERHCLVATAGIWTWLLTLEQGSWLMLGYWIPFVFSLLALIRVVALAVDVRMAAGYQREVEKAFLAEASPRGWERTRNPLDRTRVPVAAVLFWLILLVTTLLVPVYLAENAV